MADTHETIADIIAEMRRRSDEAYKGSFNYPECQENQIDYDEASEWAGRLEAAHKRDTKELRVEIERLKEERNYSGVRERERLRANGFAIVPKEQLERGDCAKLREALLKVIRSMELESGHMCTEKKYLGMHGQTQEDLCKSCRARNDECWPMTIKRECEEALAAPPRNCDKYATADEALKAQEQMFNDSNFANGECKLGCPECDNPRVGCKIAWLFATATEKEGGAR